MEQSGEEENGPSRQHEDTKIEDAGGEQKGPGEPAAESADGRPRRTRNPRVPLEVTLRYISCYV